jgi:hypothetical protein
LTATTPDTVEAEATAPPVDLKTRIRLCPICTSVDEKRNLKYRRTPKHARHMSLPAFLRHVSGKHHARNVAALGIRG